MTHKTILVSALLLGACAGPAPQESYYVLSAPPAAATGATPRVLVGAVSVPESVDRTAMVIRVGPNKVDIDDANRWAEPLKAALPRVLAENLRRELGSTNVYSGRQAATPTPDFRVGVDVQRFDSSLDEGATLDALWTVTPATGPARSGQTVAKERAATRDAAGIAAAHSKAVEALARDIAAAIKR
jgi:uncharacterized lipoprotein YmbA